MYQIFKDQLEKSKLIISGVKRNQRLGRDAGVEESVMQKMEEDCKRLEAISAEIDKLNEEMTTTSDLDEMRMVFEELSAEANALMEKTDRFITAPNLDSTPYTPPNDGEEYRDDF
jgi:methyl-accepting chemotaxis protein